MIKPLLTLSFSLTVISLLAQNSSQKWDLRRCVEYAMKNNLSVKQADIQARQQALQLKQAKLFQYPTASLSTSVGPQFGRSIDPTTNIFSNTELYSQNINVGGGVQIFNWNRIKNNIKANEFNIKAALIDIERAANDVGLNVASSYLQVIAAKEQMNVFAVQIAQTQAQLNITQKRVNAGALPELNIAELDAQLATDSSNYINTKTTFEQNVILLKGLLNLDMAEPFEVETPTIDKITVEPLSEVQPDMVYKLALSNQPLQKGNALRTKAAETNIAVAKATMYPTFSGNFGLGSVWNSRAQTIAGKTPYFDQINQNFRQNVGVGVQVPIFNSGQNRINYETSKISLQNTKLQETVANQKLQQDVYTAYTNVTNALQQVNASKRSVETAQKAYDFATKRYEVGLLNTIDLITNQNNLARAKIQLLNNQYQFVFRMKVLEFYKGLGLKL